MGTDLYVIYDWMRDNGKALRSTVEKVYGATPSSPATNGREPVHAAADAAKARPPHA
jgi:hypothetical protein